MLVSDSLVVKIARRLRMKCKCGHWNSFPAQKIFLKHKVKGILTFIPVYHVSEVVKCEKCGSVITQPKELIKIQKG